MPATKKEGGRKKTESKARADFFMEGEIVDLMEAGNDSEAGPIWDVVLIRPGLSKNATYYPEAVLQKAAELFEGAPAFSRSDDAHSWDADKSVQNIVAIYKEVEYREGGLKARMHLLKDGQWLHEKMMEARALGRRDLFGLSIVAGGTASIKRHKGQMVRMVESIDRVVSVDPVVNPAAGGRFVKLAAALNDQVQGEIEMLKTLLNLIESKRPDLLKDKDLENITEAEVMDLAGQAMLTEAEITAARQTKTETQTHTVPGPSQEEINRQVETRLTEAEARWECRMMLTAKLAESKLPEQAVARIQKQFNGNIFTEAELDKAIKEERDYIALFSNSGQVTGAGGQTMIEAGLDPREKMIAALDGFFLKTDQKIGDRVIPQYRSFKEAYRDITGDVKLSGRLSEAVNLHLFAEAGVMSTTWSKVLGDSIRRKMLADYAAPGYLQDWRRVVSEISSITDFRTVHRMRLGGYGVLPNVAERGNYNELTTPGDEEATFSIGKKGGIETVTLETIANDDVGAVRRIPTNLALAALITLYRAVFDIFLNNPVCTYDNKALFHADHGNLGNHVLDATGITNTRIAMRSQAAYGDAYKLLALAPKLLLVPNELEELAFKLCQAAVTLVNPGSNESSDMPNLNKKYGMDYSVIDYWTDATDWAAVGDTAACPTIEVGFYQGREEPELFLQSSPDSESMFNADKLSYKIRHIWGIGVLEHRNMYKHVVNG